MDDDVTNFYHDYFDNHRPYRYYLSFDFRKIDLTTVLNMFSLSCTIIFCCFSSFLITGIVLISVFSQRSGEGSQVFIEVVKNFN